MAQNTHPAAQANSRVTQAVIACWRAHKRSANRGGAAKTSLLQKLMASAVLTHSLAACGGSDSAAEYPQALAAAQAKEAEARALGVEAPCDQPQQCGVLTFRQTDVPCPNYIYKPYSLVSSTAGAASAAATLQWALALRAQELTPKSDRVCAAYVTTPPALTCAAGKCQTTP